MLKYGKWLSLDEGGERGYFKAYVLV